MMATRTFARFHFDGLEPAARALLVVLADARADGRDYRFGGLSAQQVLDSGLWMEGDITSVAAKVEKIPGAVRSSE